MLEVACFLRRRVAVGSWSEAGPKSPPEQGQHKGPVARRHLPPGEEDRGGVCCDVKPHGLMPRTPHGHGAGDALKVRQPTL